MVETLNSTNIKYKTKEPTMKEMVKLLLVKVTNLEARMDRLEQLVEKIEKDIDQLKTEAIKHGWNII